MKVNWGILGETNIASSHTQTIPQSHNGEQMAITNRDISKVI